MRANISEIPAQRANTCAMPKVCTCVGQKQQTQTQTRIRKPKSEYNDYYWNCWNTRANKFKWRQMVAADVFRTKARTKDQRKKTTNNGLLCSRQIHFSKTTRPTKEKYKKKHQLENFVETIKFTIWWDLFG